MLSSLRLLFGLEAVDGAENPLLIRREDSEEDNEHIRVTFASDSRWMIWDGVSRAEVAAEVKNVHSISGRQEHQSLK